MPGRDFFDTNIILYAKMDDSTPKHGIARRLLERAILSDEPCISIQVVNEFVVNASRKGKGLEEVAEIARRLFSVFHVAPLTMNTVTEALRLIGRYRFSYWDSLIAALEERCSILYTEDLQHGQVIDGVLKVVNPFAE